MANETGNLYLIERSRQRLILGALIAVVALGAFAPRNQREMFSAAGRELPAPTAFAAFAEPEVVLPVAEDPRRRSRIFRLPRLALQRPKAAVLPLATPGEKAPVLLAALDPAITGFVATDENPPIPGSTDVPGVVTEDDGVLVFDPIPVVGVVGDITEEETPPAPGVPEPTTWLMLIFGFAIVGAAMRRSQARVATTSAA